MAKDKSFSPVLQEPERGLNPFDPKFRARDLQGKTFFVQYHSPSAPAGDEMFWTAPSPCVVLRALHFHRTQASGSSPQTLTLVKLTGTQDVSSGVNVLSTTVNLKATNKVVTEIIASGTIDNKTLAATDKLGISFGASSPTGLNDLVIVVELQML